MWLVYVILGLHAFTTRLQLLVRGLCSQLDAELSDAQPRSKFYSGTDPFRS